MELFFLSALLLVVVFISVTLKLILYKHKYQIPPGAKLPPGKTGWPVLGESLEFLRLGRKGLPEKFIRDRMRRFSKDVFKTSLLGESAAVFCGAPGNKFLFSNENKLVTAWWPRSVDNIFPSPIESKEESKRMRKLLPRFLKPEALQRYVGIMDSIAKKHLDTNWDNKKEVLVFSQAKNYTFSLAMKLFISVEDPDLVENLSAPFLTLTAGIISIPIDLPGTPFNRAIKASNFIRKGLISIIKKRKIDLAEKKASPTQDILSHMLLTSDENGQFMTELDIANKILGLLIGAHDTTSAAITFIIKYLAELPHIYEQVLKEQWEIAETKKTGELLSWEDIQKMKYTWNVACEVMRLSPPLQGAFREAITDFTYAGYLIPKGWKIYWSSNSTHRNPEYYPEPEKFDPTRFEGNGPAPYTFVPFGGGPRMCPGKEYARLEILVFMHNVVRRYKWQKLLPKENIIVDPLPMPAKGLPVHLVPH